MYSQGNNDYLSIRIYILKVYSCRVPSRRVCIHVPQNQTKSPSDCISITTLYISTTAIIQENSTWDYISCTTSVLQRKIHVFFCVFFSKREYIVYSPKTEYMNTQGTCITWIPRVHVLFYPDTHIWICKCTVRIATRMHTCITVLYSCTQGIYVYTESWESQYSVLSDTSTLL